MKLGRCEAWNFGSYPHLEIDLANIGLGLIYGKTGSGKSTIPDIPCWAMFGVTAKNGAADDVRSWQTPNEPTKVILDVQLHEGSITITRIRGRAGQNDLYWTESTTPDKKERGKDLAETQRRLSARIGCDADLYLSASYFCDFSPSGSFFLAKSKERRELFEKIAALDFPVKLADKLSEARKASKKDLEKTELDSSKISGKIEQLKASEEDLLNRYSHWELKRGDRLHTAQTKVSTIKASIEASSARQFNIDFIKEELKELSTQKPVHKKSLSVYNDYVSALAVLTAEHSRLSSVNTHQCPTCLSPQESNFNRKERVKELSREIKIATSDVNRAEGILDSLTDIIEKEPSLTASLRKLEEAQAEACRLLAQAQQELQAANNEDNPFTEPHNRVIKDLETAAASKASLNAQNRSIGRRVASLSLLYDLSFNLRSELLKKAVKDIETSTNNYLEKYFDAEIRVSFSANDADNLDVIIQKSGFECNFKQLSKGQRQLLKLCFSISIMQASANSAGIHFSNIFMDEALDGLDEELKIKAFNLFSELETEHESILVIEHAPAFQNLFSKRYQVIMDSDVSSIELEHE